MNGRRWPDEDYDSWPEWMLRWWVRTLEEKIRENEREIQAILRDLSNFAKKMKFK